MVSGRVLVAAGALLIAPSWAALGCGGDDDDSAESVGPPATAGIAKAADVSWQDVSELGEEEGAVEFSFAQQGKPVTDGVVLKLRGTGKQAGVVEKGAPGKRFVVGPGVYALDVEYAPSEQAKGTGKVTNLVVRTGRLLKCQVTIDHPVGVLELRFTNEGVDVDAHTRVTVYHAGEDPEVSVPVVSRHDPRVPLTLSKGLYDVHAEYDEGPAVRGSVWLKGLSVPGEMQKLSETRDFGLKLTGVTVSATNFGQEVNARTSVYLYRPGADMSYAVAVARGKAGHLIPVEPGTYDLRVVFQPSDNPDTWADKKMLNVAVGTTPENNKLPMSIEMEKPIATMQIKVLVGGKDVTEKSLVRIINAGADRGAASDVVNVIGESRIVVPAGRYEMIVSYKDGGHQAEGQWESITLEQGAVISKEIRLGS